LTRLALGHDFAPAMKLAILVPIGALAYLVITALLAREQFLHAWSLVTPERFRRNGVATVEPLLLRQK
jgi:hypothetical protein